MEPTRVVRSDEGQQLQIGPATVVVKTGSDMSSGSFLGLHTLPTGFSGPPPHLHSEMDHLFYVLEGEVWVKVGGEEATLSPGDIAFMPRGVAHSFGNGGATDARLLEFNVPGGFDRYYEELATAFPAGTAVEPGIVRDIMRRYGTRPV